MKCEHYKKQIKEYSHSIQFLTFSPCLRDIDDEMLNL